MLLAKKECFYYDLWYFCMLRTHTFTSLWIVVWYIICYAWTYKMHKRTKSSL